MAKTYNEIMNKLTASYYIIKKNESEKKVKEKKEACQLTYYMIGEKDKRNLTNLLNML